MKRVQRVETKIIERLAGQADEGLDDNFRDPCPHQGSFAFFCWKQHRVKFIEVDSAGAGTSALSLRGLQHSRLQEVSSLTIFSR